MMNSITMMPLAPIPAYLPQVHQPNPPHEVSSNSTVLDLCLKKRPPSPNYPYDYKSPKPSYAEYPCASPRSETSSDIDVTSSENMDYNATFSINPVLKRSRPFKAYPKDPLSAALMGTATEHIFGKESAEAYSEFRTRMLTQVQANQNGTNKNMRRIQNMQNSGDPTYIEKRKKNNEAAKRSRDARRAKEDEIAIRCAFLEQENIQLKFRLAALEKEREKLQSFVFH